MPTPESNSAKPMRRMIYGIVIGLILAGVLMVVFYDRVHKPAVSEKPVQAPLKTQR
jgi:hypothetical protein